MVYSRGAASSLLVMMVGDPGFYQTSAPLSCHGAREVAKAERPHVGEGLLERAPPARRPVGDAVLGADGADLGGDLAQAVGREAGKEVVLDLPVEPAAEDRDRQAHLVVVGGL